MADLAPAEKSSPSATLDLTPLERQLVQVHDRHVKQIYCLLEWLCFASEPLQQNPGWNRTALTLAELESASIPEGTRGSLDFGCILDLLGHIVELEVEKSLQDKPWHERADVSTLTLEPWVRKELLSEHFRDGPAGKFACDETTAKEDIAYTCLTLLVRAGSGEGKGREPLSQFAALYWFDFIDRSNISPRCDEAIRKLFLSGQGTLDLWVQFLLLAHHKSPNNKHKDLIFAVARHTDRTMPMDVLPLVWAAAIGMKSIVEELLRLGTYVNQTGKKGVTALYMAVHEKHFDIASLLLNRGGDLVDNYQEPRGKFEYGWAQSPLYLASHRGFSREWIALLLKDKTKLGRPGWRLEVAMESASHFGYVNCLKALVDAGADLNRASGYEESYGCPLQAACDYANEATVRFLLESGADPNVTGGTTWLGEVCTPLQMASWRGHVKFVRLLLEYGADPNIQGGIHGTALLASTWNITKNPKDGHEEVVNLLLEHGAMVDVEWDMTAQLYELNFEYSEDRKVPLNEKFREEMVAWIKSHDHDSNDKSEQSEATLRERIEKKWERIHEGQRRETHGYQCGCINQKGTPLHPFSTVYIHDR